MTLDDVMQGWHWSGEDGTALATAYAKSEATGTGILFMGTAGSGKTLAAGRLVAAHGGGQAQVVHCDIAGGTDKLAGWREWALTDYPVMLDEIGRDGVRVEYGNRRDDVAQFVRALYASWKRGEWSGRLYATTNLDVRRLVAAYDASVADRLLEMCVVCEFRTARRRMAGTRPVGKDDGAGGGGADGNARPVFHGYAWGRYGDHGIDVNGRGFSSGCFAASRSSVLSDALRFACVNLGALGADECEMVRAVAVSGARSDADLMWRYVRDAFIYGLAAPEKEWRAFFLGMAGHAREVFGRSEKVKGAFRAANVETFRTWRRRFRVEVLYVADDGTAGGADAEEVGNCDAAVMAAEG